MQHQSSLPHCMQRFYVANTRKVLWYTESVSNDAAISIRRCMLQACESLQSFRTLSKSVQSGLEAMETCDLSEPLALARIAAAAEEGNVSEAAQVLDLLNNTAWLRVNVQHVSSAIRSCWGWGKTEHRAAKYFYKLLPDFEILPNIIVFTALIGAYKAAPLNEIVSAYQEMKDLKILPNIVFCRDFHNLCFANEEILWVDGPDNFGEKSWHTPLQNVWWQHKMPWQTFKMEEWRWQNCVEMWS